MTRYEGDRKKEVLCFRKEFGYNTVGKGGLLRKSLRAKGVAC